MARKALPTKGTTHVLLRLLEQGPEVSLLLLITQVECRLSKAPPISMSIVCANSAPLPSV
ncbi:hypothetical protein SynSYN20_02022 [Synechococcus sp. SYN20]|nr:hypothetical protein SynMVIR181_01732 [Synechococcus sp. MVIR-18-1]QNJ26345.1 hypothetical protein SynSYN20_02022 [Synechococcus sp. SYN20]